MAVECFVVPQDVELDGLEIGEIGAIEDVVDFRKLGRFPDVHADEDIAATNSLFGGRAVGADGQDRQASVVSRLVLLELRLRNDLELQSQQIPGWIAYRLLR